MIAVPYAEVEGRPVVTLVRQGGMGQVGCFAKAAFGGVREEECEWEKEGSKGRETASEKDCTRIGPRTVWSQ